MAEKINVFPIIVKKDDVFVVIDKSTGYQVVGVCADSKENLQRFLEHYNKSILGYLKYKDSMSFLSSLMAHGHIHPSLKDARHTIDVWRKKGVILS